MFANAGSCPRRGRQLLLHVLLHVLLLLLLLLPA
jgi:hypothetical protein